MLKGKGGKMLLSTERKGDGKEVFYLIEGHKRSLDAALAAQFTHPDVYMEGKWGCSHLCSTGHCFHTSTKSWICP